MKHQITTEFIVNYSTFQKIRTLVCNETGNKIEISGVSSSVKDTDYTYQLLYCSDKKLNKNKVFFLNSFISGIIATMKSF